MRHVLRLVPMPAPIFVLAAATIGLAGGACSSSSPSAATPGNDAGSTPDTSAPSADAATMEEAAAPEASAPDAAPCEKHLPSGFTQVVGSSSDTRLGTHASMALDENDDPMFAYADFQASGTAQLDFVRWDRCAGAFTAPVTVDTLGAISTSAGVREVSLAYDRSTREIGIAYMKIVADPGLNEAKVVWLASRKDGAASFALQQVSEGEHGDSNGAETPSIAMNAGAVYLAYVQNNYDCGVGGSCSTVWFLDSTVPPAGDAGAADAAAAGAGGDAGTSARTFNHGHVMFGGDIAQARFDSVSVAVDSAGAPAVAFFAPPATGYETTLLFWRKGMSEAAQVDDSNGIQNDSVDVTLAFDGVKPRVAGHLTTADPSTADLVYGYSDDGGGWYSISIPRNGDSETAYTSALADDGAGHVAVAAEINSGSGTDCGANPYLARSSDNATWAVCGADTAKAHKWTASAMNAAFGTTRRAGKLTLGFQNGNVEGEQAGVVYWQE